MQNYLLIDTTSNIGQVAIAAGEQFYLSAIEGAKNHTEQILPLIEDLISQADLKNTDIEAVVVTKGPGSFTGVRVGFCVATGFAYGLQIPVIGISTLEAYACSSAHATSNTPILALMDARLGQLYAGCYGVKDGIWQNIGEDCLVNPQDVSKAFPSVAPVVIYGEGYPLYKEVLDSQFKDSIADETLKSIGDVPNHNYVNLQALSQLAKSKPKEAPLSCQPIYLRNEVTHQKTDVKN